MMSLIQYGFQIATINELKKSGFKDWFEVVNR